MATTEIGRTAEATVVTRLKNEGHVILAQNWRAKACEIDVVSRKDKTIYFTEVKFRGSDYQGDGFSYITPTKLKQMKFAALMWIQFEHWDGDYRLLAAAVDKDGAVDIVEID